MPSTNAIVFDLGIAIGEVLEHKNENGNWYRYDQETLKSTGQSEVVRYYASNEWDDSKPQSMSINKGYHRSCSCCYLGINHTELRHKKNLDSLKLDETRKVLQTAPIGSVITVSFDNHIQAVYKKRDGNNYHALPESGIGSTLEEILPSLLGCRVIIG